MKDIAKIDRALDETLVGLGNIVLNLAHPSVSRTGDERQALAKSVRQFTLCANKSSDHRVHELRVQLQAVKPTLRLVSSK